MMEKHETPYPFAFQLGDLFRLMRQSFDAEDGPEITRAQAKMLLSIWRSPGISQQALATRLDIADMTVSRQVDALEAKRMIERRAHADDRRIKRLYVTDKTMPLIEQIMAQVDEVSARLLTPLGADEQAHLSNLITRIIDHASQKRSEPEQ